MKDTCATCDLMEKDRKTYVLLDAEQEEIYRLNLTDEQYNLMKWLMDNDMLASSIRWRGEEEDPTEI